MTRDEIKKYVADLIDDTLETINYKLSVDEDMSFEEIDELVNEVWDEQRN